jgi:hypothetical protein
VEQSTFVKPGNMLREDDEKYSGISVEEYNLIKMPPFAKAQKTVKQLRMYINSNGMFFEKETKYLIMMRHTKDS